MKLIAGIRRYIALIAMVAIIAVMPVAMIAKDWEPIKSEPAELKIAAREGDIEIKANRGVVVITTGHTIRVQVFTILGQLVRSDTLNAGTHRLAVDTHGVYLIKAGDVLTAKVAI